MKKYIIVFFLLLYVGAIAQQKEYSGQMHITPLALEQRGDSLYIKLNFNISGVNVDSRRSISLIPALVVHNKRFDFPEVIVKGRGNYNVYQRQMSLMSKRQRESYSETAPYAVLKGFKSDNDQSVEYDKVIKFEPWMADAKLDIYEDLCGCGNPARRMGVTMLVNQVTLKKVVFIEPYVITPYLAFVQPEIEVIKRREIVEEVFLDFAVGKTDICSDYMNNPRELKKITDLISEIKNNRDLTVRLINVTGYASPEGTIEGNKRLSEGRAKALVGYLKPRFDYGSEFYKVVYGGENWNGLREMVTLSDMRYKQQVLNIIENIPEKIDLRRNISRKKSLMDLAGGQPYNYMLREFFPSLRKAVCKIYFEVKNFDVTQAKEIVRTCPQNLSLDEMYLVANTYKKGSQEFIDLFEKAVQIFPDDATANINAAAAVLSRGDTVYAQQYLDRIKVAPDNAEYNNVVGVLAMLKGDYQKAEQYFEKAVSAGLEEAKQNLKELSKKRENINLIEQQKLNVEKK